MISGGTATVLDLGLLFVFTDLLGMWYFSASVAAFLLAFVASFVLQKYWTFAGSHERRKRQQLPLHFLLNAANLAVNSLGMYLLVSMAHIWYLLAQAIMSALIAISSYHIYRNFIFKAASLKAIET